MGRRNARVLVTGASGFVGTALINRLANESGVHLRAGSRHLLPSTPGAETILVPDLGSGASWSAALQGIDVVIHLAARVHVMRDRATDPLAEFQRVNTTGTAVLARQAAQAGARRFVFLSSVKVNGEETSKGCPYTENDAPAPVDAYGVSKYEAEVALRKVAAETGLEVVIIRPPLVYGPGVKANFRRLVQLVSRGVPLPFGAIHNLRSFVALDNLVDLISVGVSHPAAANQTFLVSDGEDMSTTELLRRVGRALGSKARLIPVPAAILRATLTALNRRDIALRLCGSLQVDISRAREMLDWRPPLTVDEALRRVTIDFLASDPGASLNRTAALE